MTASPSVPPSVRVAGVTLPLFAIRTRDDWGIGEIGALPACAAWIRSAVETLPLEQRQAIELAFLGGMTQNEISETLKQPLGTIKARIRRGMLKLRDSLKELL